MRSRLAEYKSIKSTSLIRSKNMKVHDSPVQRRFHAQMCNVHAIKPFLTCSSTTSERERGKKKLMNFREGGALRPAYQESYVDGNAPFVCTACISMPDSFFYLKSVYAIFGVHSSLASEQLASKYGFMRAVASHLPLVKCAITAIFLCHHCNH